MSGLARKFTASAVAISLAAVPAGGFAAAPAPAIRPMATAAVPYSVNPWLTLSAMTSSSSAAANAAALQDEDDDDDEMGIPPWPALGVMLATVALGIYILTIDGGDELDFVVSPP
jgi:hypothetical protein